MSAALRLPPVTRKQSATIQLAHTAVFANLGTLVTEKHAQVRNLAKTMSLGNVE